TYNELSHLAAGLKGTDTEERDVVVMAQRLLPHHYHAEHDVQRESLFTEHEQRLFTRVVAVAEKEGKPVKMIVVPAINMLYAIAQTALRLDSAEIVLARSNFLRARQFTLRFRRSLR